MVDHVKLDMVFASTLRSRLTMDANDLQDHDGVDDPQQSL